MDDAAKYRRMYDKLRRSRNRAEWCADQTGCAYCGCAGPLNMVHIDPRTKTTSSVWNWGKVRRDAVIAKCQALCRPCHLEKISKEWSGSKNPTSKLTEEQVLRIRKRDTDSDTLLAEEYGVSRAAIYLIRKRRTWQHI